MIVPIIASRLSALLNPVGMAGASPDKTPAGQPRQSVPRLQNVLRLTRALAIGKDRPARADAAPKEKEL